MPASKRTTITAPPIRSNFLPLLFGAAGCSGDGCACWPCKVSPCEAPCEAKGALAGADVFSLSSSIRTSLHFLEKSSNKTGIITVTMTMSKKTKKIIADYFSRKPEVAAVYLYGSQARGDAKNSSDIDLAVLVTNKRKYTGFGIPQVVFAQDLSKLIGKEVEVQDLEVCRIDFAHRVLTEGKLLVSNNEPARIAFEEKVLRTYFDMKPFLDEYYKSLSEIAKKGELHVRYT